MKRLLATTAFAAALALLLAISARAAGAQDFKINQSNTVEGIVVPDTIYDRQPFTFAVPQSAGTVVNVQTVSGEVVQRASTDRYGRVFLPAGLPAGTYLIAPAGGGSGHLAQPLGKIEITQRASNALQHLTQPMQLRDAPRAVKLNDSLSLKGQGFSPNSADMQANLAGAGQTNAVPVLAATENQLKLAPVSQVQPGIQQLTVTNSATGQSTAPQQVLLYDMQGSIGRHKLASHHDQTQLVVTTQPADLPLRVRAAVVNGPVDFGGGRREAEAVSSNGRAVFPVSAGHGSGPFQLTWELVDSSLPLLPAASSASGEGQGREAAGRGLLDQSNDGYGGTTSTSSGSHGGTIADDTKDKNGKKDDDPKHTPTTSDKKKGKRCEWRFLRVEKTNYTQDSKQLAEDKAKLGKALLDFVGKAAPAAGKVTKAALDALSITRANNVYLVYILVEIDEDGTEKVIDTRVVGPLPDNEAVDFWTTSRDDDGARQNTILRNRPRGGCPNK